MPNGIWGTDPLYMTENSQTYFYHNDALGTPQKMTDASGTVVWSAAYTAFGEATVDASSTITSNLRFAGQYFDQETGLHYNWNRYYDPRTGKYTTKDPIGFEGEDVNLYRYVGNNPINRRDPLGLMGPNLKKTFYCIQECTEAVGASSYDNATEKCISCDKKARAMTGSNTPASVSPFYALCMKGWCENKKSKEGICIQWETK